MQFLLFKSRRSAIVNIFFQHDYILFFVVEVGNSGSNDHGPLMDKFQLASFAFAGHSKFCLNKSHILFFCFGSGEGRFK
jgi:hypothetical protein